MRKREEFTPSKAAEKAHMSPELVKQTRERPAWMEDKNLLPRRPPPLAPMPARVSRERGP